MGSIKKAFDLTGRTALVTGGSRGLGLQIAEALGEQGAKIILSSRKATDLKQAQEHLAGLGIKSDWIAADNAREDDVKRLADEAIDKSGKVDILVNNAGITRDTLMLRMKRDDWDAVIATNLTGAFTCTQAVLKGMVKQRYGRIVTISSVVGQSGNAGQANYAASKAGLIGFSKALAREVASRNITVNVVAPGLIDTDMTRAITDAAQQDWAASIPLGRLGTPDDIAAAVCFLASDAASYITGHVLAVNGGMYS